MLELDSPVVAPSREPLQQIDAGDLERLLLVVIAIVLAEPEQKLPVERRKQFLFVRRTRGDFNQLTDGAMTLAGARTKQIEVNFQRVEFGMVVRRANLAEHVKLRARAIEMRRRRRKHPVLQVREYLLLLLGLLDLGKAIEVRVAH